MSMDGDSATAGVATRDAEAERIVRLIRLLDRLQRRYTDVLRSTLARLGAEDISPIQALMLIHIGSESISLRTLIDRGCYMGSNASYNLRSLIEAGYVERSTEDSDRRAARVTMTEKGAALLAGLRSAEVSRLDRILGDGVSPGDLSATETVLRSFDRLWSYETFDGSDVR